MIEGLTHVQVMMMLTRYFHYKGQLITKMRTLKKDRMYKLIEEHNIPIMELWNEYMQFKQQC